MAALQGDDYDGDGGSDCQDGVQQAHEDLDNFSNEPEEVEEHDDQDLDWNEEGTANDISHLISNAMQTSSSNPHASPSDPHDAISASHPQVIILEPEELDPGPAALRTDPEKSVTVQRVDDLTQPTIPCEDEHNRTTTVVSETQNDHAPESSMSAEQRIKQLEEKVAELDALRHADAASISSYVVCFFQIFLFEMLINKYPS